VRNIISFSAGLGAWNGRSCQELKEEFEGQVVRDLRRLVSCRVEGGSSMYTSSCSPVGGLNYSFSACCPLRVLGVLEESVEDKSRQALGVDRDVMSVRCQVDGALMFVHHEAFVLEASALSDELEDLVENALELDHHSLARPNVADEGHGGTVLTDDHLPRGSKMTGREKEEGGGRSHIGLCHGKYLVAEGMMLWIEPNHLHLSATQQTPLAPCRGRVVVEVDEDTLELSHKVIKVLNVSSLAAKHPLGGEDSVAPVPAVIVVAESRVVLSGIRGIAEIIFNFELWSEFPFNEENSQHISTATRAVGAGSTRIVSTVDCIGELGSPARRR
jgi:hypothetical protein